ncbi:putative leucine-rich repeat receptor-like protein kinase [Chlorella vulgaris]
MWLVQEKRSGPLRPSGGTAAGPTTQAAIARASGKLTLAVLATPGPPQLTILGHLKRNDKMRLGSACTSLRQASLPWFPEMTVAVKLGWIHMASLAAWLERHQACLHLIVDRDDAQYDYQELEAEWNDSLTALPSFLVTSLAVCVPGLPAAVSTLTALTRLELEYPDSSAGGQGNELPFSISAHHLRPLMRLRQLSFINTKVRINAARLLSLPALAGLQALKLIHCRKLEGMPLALGFSMPQQLAALTALTRLKLSGIIELAGGWHRLLPLTQLQYLGLKYCGLTALPQQLSALTALTRLALFNNKLASGWQHLLPLTQLQNLDLGRCDLEAVPQQLSMLTAVTRLNLSDNKQLAAGWQHLLPLTQLCDLDLYDWRLTAAVPAQLSALTALTRLGMGGTLLTDGWQQPLIQLLDLNLFNCGLKAVPQQLSVLTAVTRLDLSCNCWQLASGCQHLLALTQLQDLRLYACDLRALPHQLSALTALTRLNLSYNEELAGGWQHLRSLARLQDLDLDCCCFAALPHQISALTALTCLDLSRNGQLAGSWQHLLALTRLQILRITCKSLPGGQVPPKLATLPHLRIECQPVRSQISDSTAMGSRSLEETRSGPLRPSGSTAAGPTNQAAAARAAGDLMLTVLAAPGPPQLTILGHVKQIEKMWLGSACTSLRQASLPWFPEVTVEVTADWIHVASLAAWLERHQARLHLQLRKDIWRDVPEWTHSTIAALPACLVSSVTASHEIPAAVSNFTALTRLDFTGWYADAERMPASLLRPLSRLRQLSVSRVKHTETIIEEILALPSLRQLQALQLSECSLQTIPPGLSALTHLTALALKENNLGCSATTVLTALQCLQSLDLERCSLRDVPQQVSALTALTRLNVNGNGALQGGWQHVLPLTQLQDLDLGWLYLPMLPGEVFQLTALTRLDHTQARGDRFDSRPHLLLLTQLRDLSLEFCSLEEVPEQVSALTALTYLSLSGNLLAGGWQHLLPLTQLRHLYLQDVLPRGRTAPRQLAALPMLRVHCGHIHYIESDSEAF